VINPPVPVKVTEEPVDVKTIAEELLHEPAIEIVEDPKVRAAGPFELRFPPKSTVAPVSVSVPDQETFEGTEVEIPGLTMRL
jgi:hypothetical protein